MNPPLLGYADRLSVRAGERIEFKVSSLQPAPFEARLVRVVCADPNPNGPGQHEEAVPCAVEGAYPSREQPFWPGSLARTDAPFAVGGDGSFRFSVLAWPTLPGDGEQVLLAHGERRLLLDAAGRLAGEVGAQRVTAKVPLDRWQWVRVWLAFDAGSGLLTVGCVATGRHGDADAGSKASITGVSVPDDTPMHLLAAAAADTGDKRCFNGKLEAPAMSAGANGDDSRLLQWDFSRHMGSLRVEDVSGHGRDGTLVNLPARAMTGAAWNGAQMCWRHAPEHYGAIHFHDDDIYDFGWESDIVLDVPAETRSGLYALRIRCGDYEDAIPFAVPPPRGERRARLAVLISTFTFSVYGNFARPDFVPAWRDRFKAWGAYPYNPVDYPQYGCSTYNVHRDGSGVCHASHRRPLFSIRPGYVHFGYGDSSSLRHLQADTHLLAWLEHCGYDYDVVSDQELHDEGVSALQGYAALTTGSHPEYHTANTLDAIEQYRDSGGKLCYLGGNGFYWRVALHSQVPGAIEVRRAEGGIRSWAADPGEYYHAFDGEYGGLWRRNGRPPQTIGGVGFTAQGNFTGSYYRRQPGASDPRASWIFEGIDDELIGDFGYSGGGAAGYELDRVDYRLGTPPQALVLASSELVDEDFQLVPEERLTHLVNLPRVPEAELLRADMVYYELPGGGAVFSTGSITFCGSLPWNHHDNNVSTLMRNVLNRFLA